MKNIEELIDALHLEDVRNETHPSFFDDNEEYNMLIARIPIVEETLTGKSFAFILSDNKSYMYDKEKKEFKELKDIYMGPYAVIDKSIDKLLKSFLKYQEKISDMEELLYSNKTDGNFLNTWLALKVDILRIERTLLRTANTMDEFIGHYKEESGFPLNHYGDILEHIERIMRSATHQLSKLDYLYSFYNAKSNDKINKMIYLLTIISAIFLPLNLVVGFFGMNTSGLPFANGTSGTYFAISLMISLVVITSVVVQFWRKKVEK